jgi:serine/threonine-protein kinase SRPK3
MEIQNYFDSRTKRPKKLPENMHQRGPLASEDIKLKICDLGNGCWTHHHFTTKI